MISYVVFTVLFIIWAYLYWALWRDRNRAYRHWFEFRDWKLDLEYRCSGLQRENQHLRTVLEQAGLQWSEGTRSLERPLSTGSGTEAVDEETIELVADDSGDAPQPAARPRRTAAIASFLRRFWAEVLEYV